MPQMGYDMQEGTLVRWLKSEGSEVNSGEAIAEIETDKAVVEFESTSSGVLRKILVQEGTTVPVGQAVAIIGGADEEIPDDLGGPVETQELPDAEEAGEASGIPLPPPAAQPEATVQPKQQVRASPVARQIGADKGIDLTLVKGTGPGGRITRDDVLAHAEAQPVEAAAPPQPTAEAPPQPTAEAPPQPTAEAPSPPAAAGPGEKVSLTRMRQQIARVTVKSKQEIPHFYISAEIDMSEAMKMRAQVNAGLQDKAARVSVNDLIIMSCVGALQRYPKLNASFDQDSIRMSESINVGVAIAEDEGLIVPAIMDCAGKSLVEIARASKDLIERSKSGTLRSQEYTGGTFSISNLGMFDVTSFAAIIHPPQSAVLAVGTVAKRPVVRDGEVTIAQMMTATLSADHRVADGAEGAQFLIEVKRLLENPLSLLA
jgi:pyruvate dehydrogenase E2 component (dihydrolipoamide acetyltransferase)